MTDKVQGLTTSDTVRLAFKVGEDDWIEIGDGTSEMLPHRGQRAGEPASAGRACNSRPHSQRKRIIGAQSRFGRLYRAKPTTARTAAGEKYPAA